MKQINNGDFIGMLFRAGVSNVPDNFAALSPELNGAVAHVKGAILAGAPAVEDDNAELESPDGEFEFSDLTDAIEVEGVEV